MRDKNTEDRGEMGMEEDEKRRRGYEEKVQCPKTNFIYAFSSKVSNEYSENLMST